VIEIKKIDDFNCSWKGLYINLSNIVRYPIFENTSFNGFVYVCDVKTNVKKYVNSKKVAFIGENVDDMKGKVMWELKTI